MRQVNQATDNTVEIMSIKQRQKTTWEDGDYGVFASYMEPGAVAILDDWDIPANSSLLDVACGSGQTAIPAAKKGYNVTGIDIADNLITQAKQRAKQSRLNVQFDVGDAEKLPYESQRFDAVISMFGAIFAPRPEYVSSELGRVLKSGGTLYMANWTPNSMPAQMFKLLAEVNPPKVKIVSPMLWGDEVMVKQRLRDDFVDIKLQRKIYPHWQFPFSADELVHFFRRYFGPVKHAFNAVDGVDRKRLHKRLADIYCCNSKIQNSVLTITGGEYLEVIAKRR